MSCKQRSVDSEIEAINAMRKFSSMPKNSMDNPLALIDIVDQIKIKYPKGIFANNVAAKKHSENMKDVAQSLSIKALRLKEINNAFDEYVSLGAIKCEQLKNMIIGDDGLEGGDDVVNVLKESESLYLAIKAKKPQNLSSSESLYICASTMLARIIPLCNLCSIVDEIESFMCELKKEDKNRYTPIIRKIRKAMKEFIENAKIVTIGDECPINISHLKMELKQITIIFSVIKGV